MAQNGPKKLNSFWGENNNLMKHFPFDYLCKTVNKKIEKKIKK